ncbi:MAG: choice-of-anchor Q domain-containing protein [Solirubrobacterales bacterium]
MAVSALAAASASVALLAPAAGAGTIEVTTRADEASSANGRCALREAIQSANTDSPVGGCTAAGGFGNETIRVPAGVYKLTIPPDASNDDNLDGDLDIADLTLIRPAKGLAKVAIDGNQTDRVLDTTGNGVTLARLTIRGGRLSANGAGIFNGGELTLNGVTVTGNRTDGFAGGITNSQGDLTLIRSTVSGNRAEAGGGGITTSGPGPAATTIIDSTVTANVADADGSGLGDGGGLLLSVGTYQINSSIVAGNRDLSPLPGDRDPDCSGTFTQNSFNLIGTTQGCTYTEGPGDVTDEAPNLRPLADNGGPTRTHMPGQQSPAVDAGDTCISKDQRGAPTGLAEPCDLGAAERIVRRGVLVNRVGTPSGDTLRGTAKRDAIIGLNGRDRLFGLAGGDVLLGGGRGDRLIGGRGRDFLSGAAGFDRCRGGPAADASIGCERRISIP